jgi:chromosome segregation ATPase
MDPEIGLTISGLITALILIIKFFGKPLANLFSKFMVASSGKITEQQDIRDDRTKNIEWLRSQLIDEENNNKKEIHAYKEEINNLLQQVSELNITASQAQSNLIISEAEKKILIIENEDYKKKLEKIKKELEECEKK